MVRPNLKEEWRSVLMECGGQCAVTTGAAEMQQSSADS